MVTNIASVICLIVFKHFNVYIDGGNSESCNTVYVYVYEKKKTVFSSNKESNRSLSQDIMVV